MESFLERLQDRRLKRAAKRGLLRIATPEALEIAYSEEKLEAFCDECSSIHHKEVGGPLMDAIEKLIQSFIDNPEKWINVISLIIKMFA